MKILMKLFALIGLDHWQKVNATLACIGAITAIVGTITWIYLQSTMKFSPVPENVGLTMYLVVLCIGLLMVRIKRYHQK